MYKIFCRQALNRAMPIIKHFYGHNNYRKTLLIDLINFGQQTALTLRAFHSHKKIECTRVGQFHPRIEQVFPFPQNKNGS